MYELLLVNVASFVMHYPQLINCTAFLVCSSTQIVLNEIAEF